MQWKLVYTYISITSQHKTHNTLYIFILSVFNAFYFVLYTYLLLTPYRRRGGRDISDILPRHPHCTKISDVSAVNSLVAFYDNHGRNSLFYVCLSSSAYYYLAQSWATRIQLLPAVLR
jgi:hypothetical protein